METMKRRCVKAASCLVCLVCAAVAGCDRTSTSGRGEQQRDVEVRSDDGAVDVDAPGVRVRVRDDVRVRVRDDADGDEPGVTVDVDKSR